MFLSGLMAIYYFNISRASTILALPEIDLPLVIDSNAPRVFSSSLACLPDGSQDVPDQQGGCIKRV